MYLKFYVILFLKIKVKEPNKPVLIFIAINSVICHKQSLCILYY